MEISLSLIWDKGKGRERGKVWALGKRLWEFSTNPEPLLFIVPPTIFPSHETNSVSKGGIPWKEFGREVWEIYSRTRGSCLQYTFRRNRTSPHDTSPHSTFFVVIVPPSTPPPHISLTLHFTNFPVKRSTGDPKLLGKGHTDKEVNRDPIRTENWKVHT